MYPMDFYQFQVGPDQAARGTLWSLTCGVLPVESYLWSLTCRVLPMESYLWSLTCLTCGILPALPVGSYLPYLVHYLMQSIN